MTLEEQARHHDPTYADCPWNQEDDGHSASRGLSCGCLLRPNVPIRKFEAPDAAMLSDAQLREAYRDLLAHHVVETKELYRRTKRVEGFVLDRIAAMRRSPREWGATREEFSYQLVVLVELALLSRSTDSRRDVARAILNREVAVARVLGRPLDEEYALTTTALALALLGG
jgi:hypothetical protein